MKVISETEKKEIENYFEKRKSADFIFKKVQNFGSQKNKAKISQNVKVEENLDLFMGNKVKTNLEKNYSNENIDEFSNKIYLIIYSNK